MKRRSNSRRNFLRGVGGILVGLPLLEYTHGELWAAPGKAKRLIVVFSHGGTISWRNRSGQLDDDSGKHTAVDLWAPKDPGPDLGTLGDEMAPLQSLTSDLILLRGVDNMAGTVEPYGGGHGWSNVSAMTCADIEDHGDYQLPLGPSLDQVLAARLAQDAPMPFPSIDLMVTGHQYGTPFFRAANEEVSSEEDPKAAFDLIFSGVSPSSKPDPELELLRKRKMSVLDGVLDGFSRFRKKVGTADGQLLDAHADHIRSMEKQLEALSAVVECTLPDVSSSPSNLDSAAQKIAGPLLVDIILHSLRCGLTSVATLQIADIINPWLPNPYESAFEIGHSLHHAANDVGVNGPEANRFDDWIATIVPNRNWRMELLAQLIQGLKATPEGTGNMLDNSIVMYTSEFSTGSVHSVRDVPMLLAGRAGNRWTTGKHHYFNKLAKNDPTTTEYETDVSTHNVFTSVLNAFGYDDAHFGNDTAYKTGPLAELP